MRLAQRDLDAVHAAMLDLHEERDLEEFRTAVPGIFFGVIPSDYFMWMESGYGGLEPPIQKVVLWEFPTRSKPRHVRRLMELVGEHPFTIHAKKTGDWGPLRLSDFWSTRQLKASTIYRDAYAHVGIGRLLACAAFRGNRVGTLNLARPLGARDFSDRDGQVLKLLLPHFQQGLRAAELATARRNSGSQPLPALGLTTREVDVALWLARGRTNPEIAAILAMRPRTVEKHVERILEKLGVENRTAAAMLVTGSDWFSAKPAPPAAKRSSRG